MSRRFLALRCAGLVALLACGDAGGSGAIHEIRPFELRLSSQQRWAPCTIATDSMRLVAALRCEELPLSDPALLALAQHRAGLSADSPDIHTAARIDLTLQSTDWQGYTRVVNRLRQASVLGESGADATLSTAHVLRAVAVDDPVDLVRALDIVLRARDVAPVDTVLLFNSAVLLERLHLTQAALDAWNEYLAVDAESDWAGEVRERMARLEAVHSAAHSMTGAMDVQRAREAAIDTLLPEYARRLVEGDSAGARLVLDSARVIGEALAAVNGDHSIADAVAAVDAARRDGREARVAAGLAAWGEGRDRYAEADYAAAMAPLGQAVRLLAEEPIALDGWPLLYQAAVHIQARELTDAARIYDRVRAETPVDRIPSLWARSAWGAGLVNVLESNLPLAMQRYDSAATVFTRIGERENIGGVHFLLMETYAGLGQRRQGLDHALRALAILEARPGSQMRHNTLASMGLDLRAAGFAHAAVAVLSEGEDAADRSGQPKNRIEALSRLAMAESDLHRMDAARTHVDRALGEYSLVSDRFMNDWSEAELARARARILRATDASGAWDAQTTAVDFYRRTSNITLLFRALAERAAIALDAGNAGAARTDLEEAVHDLGRRINEARSDPATIATLLESAVPVFDGLIDIHARNGALDHAFGYAETARAVELAATRPRADVSRNLFADNAAGMLRQVQAALAPRQMLLHSAVLPDRLHLWYVMRDTVVTRTIDGTEADLVDAVSRFNVLLESGAQAAADTIGARLFRMLIGRALDGQQIDELVIVPDKVLQRVPFAALRDSDRTAYLIEHVTLVMAPSAAFALNAGRQAPPDRFERVVLIADPEFDAQRFPELPRLRSARQEVQDLTIRYAGADVLDGEGATVAAFRGAIRNADLIHFAGHGRYRPDRPDLSYLVFADSEENDGALFARDIRRLELDRAPLIVLSACETALPELSRTGGYGALARAFLVAGAPAVVGSMWVVDDRQTARFMDSFHERLVTGLSPAVALREAQMNAIRENVEGAIVWAAFRYEGVAEH